MKGYWRSILSRGASTTRFRLCGAGFMPNPWRRHIPTVCWRCIDKLGPLNQEGCKALADQLELKKCSISWREVVSIRVAAAVPLLP